MKVWLVILAAGLGSYALRASMILVLGDRTLSPALERSLRLVAPAMMTALLVSTVAAQVPSLGAGELVPRAAALTVAVVTALRTRSQLATVGYGLLTLWLATALVALA